MSDIFAWKKRSTVFLYRFNAVLQKDLPISTCNSETSFAMQICLILTKKKTRSSVLHIRLCIYEYYIIFKSSTAYMELCVFGFSLNPASSVTSAWCLHNESDNIHLCCLLLRHHMPTLCISPMFAGFCIRR